MEEPRHSPEPVPDPDAETGDGGADAELAHLRELLFGEERERLLRLESRKEIKIDAAAVSEVLPDAVLIKEGEDDRLANAFSPTIEKGLVASVRKNPKVLADAIFPVIGPAIRKAIQAALAGAIENINAGIENSLSPKSLRWRWEARRAGVPYGEYLLLKSLLYRVEQMFLIHRETGLLLESEALPEVEVRDPDMISGMLSAITDFVRDSFGSDDEGALQQITVVGTRVAIVQGPHAVLAGVVRGTPPASLRTDMEEALESIHLEQGQALATYEGDSAPFRACGPRLEGLLLEKRVEKKRGRGMGMVLPAVILVGAFFLVRAVMSRSAFRRAYREGVALLVEEPGYYVVESSISPRQVRGLRDPLARPVDVVLAANASAVDWSTVDWRWSEFVALDQVSIERRVDHLLAPPEGVYLQVRDGEVVATGRAGTAWIREARSRAGALAGVRGLNESALVDVDLEHLDRTRARLDGTVLTFDDGSVALDHDGDGELLARVLGGARDLDQAAVRAGRRAVLQVRGVPSSGEDGALARERGQALTDRLLEQSMTHVELRQLPPGETGPIPELRISVLLVDTTPGEDDAR